ncbi:MAG: reverse transcriptase/maturase family protein [Rickettsiales bacterium]|nr:reverse transcriptase/maturase family protein [Rickettsiales bacterium]
MIKRKMNLSEIFTFENLHAAHELCRRGKQHKRGTIMFELDAGPAIAKLAAELATRKYKIGKYREFKLYDPKERKIKALPYRDRVVQMCFCKNALEPRLEKRLIHDNAASRAGRGTDFSVRRLHRFIRASFINAGGNGAYFLKCDVAKYFPSINHDVLLSKLWRCGFSSDEMWFMEMVIKSHGDAGVPLGNQTSQWFALLYLDDVDRLIKEKLRVAHYVRYMDDFVLLHPDKDFLQKCRGEIQRFCADKLKLKLNAKTQIGRLKNGLDFLGFNHKLTATGRVVKRMRASARARQRRYLKTLSHCYLNDVVDDEYLAARRASFRAHMAGTADRKFVMNRINTLRRIKKMKNQ